MTCPGPPRRPLHRSAAHQRTSIRDQTVGSGRAFLERTACKKQVGAASTHFVPSTKGDYYSCTTRGSIRRNQVVALPLIVLVEAIGGIDRRGACASLPAVLHAGSAGAKAPRTGHSRCDPSNCWISRLRLCSTAGLVSYQLVYSRLELPSQHPPTRTSVTMGRPTGLPPTRYDPRHYEIEDCEQIAGEVRR